MSKLNGSAIVTILDSNEIVHTTDATLTINQELPEATTKDSGGWADHINGVRNWEVTIEGYAAYDQQGNVVPLSDLVLNRQSGYLEFAPSDTDDRKFAGTVDLSSLELGSPSEETAPISSTLTGKGELTTSQVT